jgi:hypothetical protein
MSVRRHRDIENGRTVTIIDDDVAHDEHDIVTEDAVGEEEVSTAYESPAYLARGWIRTVGLWVGLALFLVEAALSFRLAFAMAAANRGNGFVDFIYDVTGPLISPFEGIASRSTIGDNGVFEPETLIAMAVYSIAAFVLIALLWVATAGPSPTSGHTVVAGERRGSHAREIR